MSRPPLRVAVVPGDGIGKEVVPEAVRVLEAAAERFGIPVETSDWSRLGADRFVTEGTSITDEEFGELERGSDAILLGALGDPRVPGNEHARAILLGLRFRFDLYVNYRPCVLLEPSHSPLRRVPEEGIRIEIFRENTEGIYVNAGGRVRAGTPGEVAIQEDVNTRYGVERIVRAAFEHAERSGRGLVTLVDKANAMPMVGGLWREVFAEVGEDHPGIEREAAYVDAVAMDLVRRPGRYQVVVTSNLFGDILSDLAAEVTGGLGIAPSANFHPQGHALFEPVHGSAPDVAGQRSANPLAAIRCVELLLDHFGFVEGARAVTEAVLEVVRTGEVTPDLGGALSTTEVGERVAARVADRG